LLTDDGSVAPPLDTPPTNTGGSGGTPVGPQTAPDGLPPGYNWNEISLTVRADAGFTSEGAYGQSVVNFNATTATADVKLTVTSGGSTIGTNVGHEKFSEIYPKSAGIVAQTTIPSQTKCGLTAAAHADGSALNQALLKLSMLSWGEKASSDDKTKAQDACQPATTGTGGGSTPPPYVTCYYIVYSDHFTGEILWVDSLGCY
jgi:hypothetical protein